MDGFSPAILPPARFADLGVPHRARNPVNARIGVAADLVFPDANDLPPSTPEFLEILPIPVAIPFDLSLPERGQAE